MANTPMPPSKFKRIQLERTHDRDLVFNGRLLGEGKHGKDITVNDPSVGRCSAWKGVEIKIYATESGKYVVYGDHFNAGDVRKVTTVCETPTDLLASLRGGGKPMPPASKQAWTEAVKNDPELAPLECEEV